jgi:tetratricopeptide (TPR) repeat protein
LPSSSTAAQSASNENAARLYHEAEAKYAEGNVPAALSRMQEAYALSGRPELLFNLGELERELGHCAVARKDYAAYLAQVPDGRRRGEAQRKGGELRRHCPDEPTKPEAPTAAKVAHSPYWTTATIAGWATIGAGLVAAAGGTYLAVQANRDEDQLEERMHAGDPYTQSDKQLEHDGERSAAWARGLFAGAAVLVTTGVTLLVLQPGSAKPRNTLAVGFNAGTATAVWRGSF